jgi:hypothetical protein
MQKSCSWKCRLRKIIEEFKGVEGCWEWQLSVNKVTGYGQFNCGNNNPIGAHRAVASLVEDTEGKFVIHKCDNRRCVNPEHLIVGTHLENMQDMVAKGRYNKISDRWHSGEEHHFVKNPELAHRRFSKEVELEIYEKAKTMSFRKVGIEYKCSHNVVGRIFRHYSAGSAKKDHTIANLGNK